MPHQASGLDDPAAKGAPSSISLFAFGDASVEAYATAIYVVGRYNDGTATSELVLAKSRVAPIKMGDDNLQQTIPRLELLAAVITARAVTYVRSALEKKAKIENIYCFNLHRIRNGPDTYKVWVGSRVKEILSLTTKEQWFHCPGIINPADLPSRGMTAEDLMSSKLWWEGPEFATQTQDLWPKEKLSQIVETEVKKLITQPSTFTAQVIDNAFLEIFDRFSSWHKTIKLLSFVLRCGHPEHKHFRKQAFSVAEKKATEMLLWRTSQCNGFADDFRQLAQGKDLAKTSKLAQHNPMWDHVKRLVVSNSRLVQSNLPVETKWPILLPKNCPIVAKYVINLHEMSGHQGAGYTLSILRQQFRLCQGRRQVQKIIRTCTKRHCMKPVPLQQQMAPLPALRTDDVGAFRHCSTDLFGPMLAKHSCEHAECPHPKTSKVYGALFTCFHSRAVHLELIKDQGTEEFLNAFRSFVARRGTPNVMFSDNAKNFKSTSKEIRSLYRTINWKTVQDDGRLKNIEWIFNVEKAPWANAVAERMVRSVKTPLRIIVGNASLTFRQMSVILSEVEGIVNNRPLATVTDDPDDLTPITPAELIMGRRMDPLPDPNIRKNETKFSHLWRKRQQVLNAFWKRWKNDYLLNQDVRKKWKTPSTEDLLHRLVLIRDDNMARNEWKLGRVVETFKSKDGFVRSVLVKTGTSTLRRPVQKLSLLENIS